MSGIRSSVLPLTQALLALTLLLANLAFAAELPDFTHLVEKNGPSVVNISTRQNHTNKQIFEGMQLPEDGPWGELFRHFFGDPQLGERPPGNSEARSLGSGVIIDEDGFIITNNHVIDGADEIIVRLGDRRELSATVIGSDPRSDIALIRIDANDLPAATIGSSDNLKVGEWVMAIGSPFGFDRSVSVGVVSALGRSLPNESYVPFIQTDVAINPGNSGGPLYNLDGEVVGINSQIYSRTGGYMGLSFAIPIDVAMEVVAQLKERGHVSRGWLGVLIQDVTAELAESFGMKKPMGALVAKVLPDSPAMSGGIEVGDIIVSLNDQPVIYSSDLPPLVGRLAAGDKANMEILRNGQKVRLKVVIGELPNEAPRHPQQGGRAVAKGSIPNLGLTATNLDEQTRGDSGVEKGVVVTHIDAGPAADAGIARGDIILKLDGKDITNLKALRETADGLAPGRTVSILIQRDNGPLFLALRIPKE